MNGADDNIYKEFRELDNSEFIWITYTENELTNIIIDMKIQDVALMDTQKRTMLCLGI